MLYKWLTETERRTVPYEDGSIHVLTTERYWIDMIQLDSLKVTIENIKLQRDEEKPEVTCVLKVNDRKVQEWFVDTLEEAGAIGAELVNKIKDDVNNAA